MRSLIGFIAFFAINSQLTSLLLVHANTEVDVNLIPAATQDQHIAALYTDTYDSDAESIPIGNGNGNGNGVRVGNYSNYEDDGGYLGSIGEYPSYDNSGYDYGEYT